MFFIPIYLKNRVTTVPGFLADRFGPACGTIYSCMLLVFYVLHLHGDRALCRQLGVFRGDRLEFLSRAAG